MEIGVFGHIEGTVERVGTIVTLPAYEEQFTYDASFLERHPGSCLSLSLPPQAEPFVSRRTRPYFKNLLPEGAALRAIAKRFEVNDTAYLQILNKLGDECIGAVAIRGDAGDASGESRYTSISRDELAAFARRESDGMAVLQAGSKLSLAGAQSKMGVRVAAGDGVLEYFLPHGDAASTHIAKTANRRFEALGENEHFCMRLAAACGIDVPDTFIDMIADDAPLFLIERYDRQVIDAELVERLHQEDFCQALGLLPERKYEQSGHRYVKSCADLIARNSSRPAEDLTTFARLIAFNLMIGNCDSHLKNMSFVCDASWRRRSLAPAYDLASTVVYGGLDRNFAMRIGSSSRIEEISRADLVLMAEEIGMTRKAVLSIVDETAESVLEHVSGEIAEIEETLHRKVDKLHAIREFAERKACDLR